VGVFRGEMLVEWKELGVQFRGGQVHQDCLQVSDDRILFASGYSC
jgi:hypothetical protein